MEAFAGLGGVGVVGTILIGIVAGWIAEKLTGSNHGLLRNLIVGLAGSWIGYTLSELAGIRIGEFFSGWFWGNVLVSAVGATLLLALIKMFRGSAQR